MKIYFNYLTLLFLLVSGIIFSQTALDSLPLKASFNFGKSVAIFGLTITNYGVPGAGFSSLQGKSMQQQVDEADVFDIYILWASTNDYTNNREVGSYTDYTEFDNYNTEKLTTQAGGINYCIKKIYEINPNATIYFFTSSKAFNDRGAYDPFYSEGMVQHVNMQKMICALHGIPVLDQFLLGGYNIYNKDLFWGTKN